LTKLSVNRETPVRICFTGAVKFTRPRADALGETPPPLDFVAVTRETVFCETGENHKTAEISPPPPQCNHEGIIGIFSRSKHLLWSFVFQVNEFLGLIPGIWTSTHAAKLRKKNYKPVNIIDKIAVIVNLRFSIEHLENILSYLGSTEYDIIYLGSSRLSYCLDFARTHNCEIIPVQRLIKAAAAYKLALAMCCDNRCQRYGIEFIAKEILMVQTMIDGGPPYFTGAAKLPFDYISCCGDYQKRRIESYISRDRLFVLGYPRISKHSTNRNEAEEIIELQAKRRLNHGKKNILWLPSHTKTTSLYTFAPALAKIQTDYNIVVKPHPLLFNIEKFITSIIPEITIINQVSNDKLLPAADFVICDYGGSVFLSIMADKNTLLFNADKPEFPPELSIQDIPELAIRDRIINFYPEEEEKFFAALKDDSVWEKQKEIRAQIRAEFFTDNPDPARDIAELCRRIVRGEI
jgi:hypothetical protein